MVGCQASSVKSFASFSGSCGNMPPMKASPNPLVTGVWILERSWQGTQRNGLGKDRRLMISQKASIFGDIGRFFDAS